jgi:hypothetical protein
MVLCTGSYKLRNLNWLVGRKIKCDSQLSVWTISAKIHSSHSSKMWQKNQTGTNLPVMALLFGFFQTTCNLMITEYSLAWKINLTVFYRFYKFSNPYSGRKFFKFSYTIIFMVFLNLSTQVQGHYVKLWHDRFFISLLSDYITTR